MTNAELIKALRCCGDENNEWCVDETYKCPLWNEDRITDDCKAELMTAAADALEAAEKRIDGLQKLVDINTDRCEALRKQLRESHESYEKHLNELEAQLPKEGEWIPNSPFTGNCSECGGDGNLKDKYCSNCGSRMRKGEQE